MARGGSRPGAGRKAKPKLPTLAKPQAESVLSHLGHEYKGKRLPKESDLWISLLLSGGDPRLSFDVLKYLTDKRDGKAMQNVNHLHDKPIEVTASLSLGEGMRIAMEKAEERVSKRTKFNS